RRPGREEALARLADRYVTSHGPVTERDFAGWCDQPLRLVREAVALTDGRVRTEQVGETAYLVHADAPPAAAAHGGDEGTLLLPGFDEWLLGYKDRRAQLTPEQERAVVPGGNGMFRGTLVADCAVAGTWRRTVARELITVEVTPFVRVTRALRAGAEGAVAAYGRFWGLPARARWVDG
ncbi:MAG: crosslink repair DNA glycosylase YcaQ family protein, partial [Candidatus Phosphoribacter baldrii]